MADINEELVGSASAAAANREKQRRKKLELKEIKLRCTIDDQFYAQAHFQEFFRRSGTQLMLLLAAALIGQSLLAKTFSDPEVSLFNKGAIVAVGVFAFVIMPAMAKGRWRHMKANNDFWVNEQSYVLNTKGLLAKNKRQGEYRLQWREIRRIFETKEAIVFVMHKFHMVVLPLGDFDEDEKQQIREIIRYCTRNMRVKLRLAGRKR